MVFLSLISCHLLSQGCFGYPIGEYVRKEVDLVLLPATRLAAVGGVYHQGTRRLAVYDSGVGVKCYSHKR